MSNHSVFRDRRCLRLAILLLTSIAVSLLSACGGNSTNNNNPPSSTKNRAFISNTFSGALQIVDTQNDTTPMTQETTNSAGQVVPGSPVTIPVANTVTFQSESPDHNTTVVYDPSTIALWFVTNSDETLAGSIALPGSTGMALFSPDSTKLYVPMPNDPVSGGRPGVVAVIDIASQVITATYAVPSARYVAISPSGQYLLVFANNSDSVYLLNLTASTVSPVEIPGFAGPVNAFFNTNNTTAYVLNCGPECGSTGAASVAQLDIPTQTIQKMVTVGGASVGLMNGTTLYVAGSPVPPGTTSTYDAVDLTNLSRITAHSVAISDGFHTTMALNNNKLYIGANTCTNTTTGCLSVVNVSDNVADPPFPPMGAVTSILSIANRNVMYVIQGGYVNIYDTSTDTLQGTQLSFSGALYSIVQVDQ